MKDYFYTISKGGKGFYKEKGSKFIGLAFRVQNEEDVREKLEEVKKQFHDARHHCYAYILSKDKLRANDDGEPNHSAGDPILGQIKSKKPDTGIGCGSEVLWRNQIRSFRIN